MPVPQDATEYILSELTRRLNEVAGRLETGLTRMDGVYVRKDVEERSRAELKQEMINIVLQVTNLDAAVKVANAEQDKRISALEEGRQWTMRLVVGALTGAAGSIVVAVLTARSAGA